MNANSTPNGAVRHGTGADRTPPHKPPGPAEPSAPDSPNEWFHWRGMAVPPGSGAANRSPRAESTKSVSAKSASDGTMVLPVSGRSAVRPAADDTAVLPAAADVPRVSEHTVVLAIQENDGAAGDQDATAVLRPVVGEGTSPVFVDESGRRRRRIHITLSGAGVLCLVYAVLVGVSLAGGEVGPDAFLPFPELVDRPKTEISQAPPAAPPTTRPPRQTPVERAPGGVPFERERPGGGEAPSGGPTRTPEKAATTRAQPSGGPTGASPAPAASGSPLPPEPRQRPESTIAPTLPPGSTIAPSAVPQLAPDDADGAARQELPAPQPLAGERTAEAPPAETPSLDPGSGR